VSGRSWVATVAVALFLSAPAARSADQRRVERRDDVPLALCNDCATPAPLPAPGAACQSVSGSTTAACPSDFYEIPMTSGTWYELSTCAAPCGGSAAFDTMIRAWDPSGCLFLAGNDDRCGLQSRLVYRAASTGPHVVEVLGYRPTDFGAYTLTFSIPSGAPTACGTCPIPLARLDATSTCASVDGYTLGCPCATTGTANACGAWYEILLVAGTTYSISTCPNLPAGCGGDATFDTRLDLWNSSCTTLLVPNDDAAGCVAPGRSALVFTPPATGIYRLQVRGYGADTGAYTLAVRSLR
jgi:hypothetical protein